MSQYSSISVLMATPITGAMLAAGTTISEPDLALGESLWVASAAYVVGDEKISAHKVYYCVLDHAGITKPPERDAEHWLFKRPSNLLAPFDVYRSTAAVGTGTLTYELDPGFFSAVRLFGVVGDQVQVQVLDAPGGSVIKDVSAELWEQALGLWELLFSALGQLDQLDVRDIPLAPAPRLRVTISSLPGGPVALGTLLLGEWRSLTGGNGGTEYAGGAEPKSASYIKFNDDGTFEIKRRSGFTDLEISALMDADQADYCVGLLQKVIDEPVAISATDVPGYGYLSTFGLVSGSVTPLNRKDARLNARVKGII